MRERGGGSIPASLHAKRVTRDAESIGAVPPDKWLSEVHLKPPSVISLSVTTAVLLMVQNADVEIKNAENPVTSTE